MEQWSEIRRRVLVGGLSRRAACREYGLHWHTLTKMLEHSEPPGYRAAQPRAKPKIGRFTGATLDRLTHRCQILECNGESYRLADAKRRRRPPPG